MRRKPIRFGLVGARRGASFARALRLIPDASLVAVYDPSEETLSRFRADHENVAEVPSFDDIVNAGVDAVFLASPQQYHAPQAIAALDMGIHVLSEIPAVVSLEQAQELVGATRNSEALYMLSENHCYLPENLTVESMLRQGVFGEIYFAEGEYLFEARDWQRDSKGQPTWRAFWQLGKNAVTYPTHTLGPLLRWMKTRVSSVTAFTAGRSEGFVMSSTIMLVGRTPAAQLIRMRLDAISDRPPEPRYLAFQASDGAYESGRGPLDRSRLYIKGRTPRGQWEFLDAYIDAHLEEPFRPLLDNPRLANSPYGPTVDFIRRIKEGVMSFDDLYFALDCTLPGILSEDAIAADSRWVSVPDPRFFTSGIGTGPGREWPLA